MKSVRKLRSRKSNVPDLMLVPSEREVLRASVVRIIVTGGPGLIMTEQSVRISLFTLRTVMLLIF